MAGIKAKDFIDELRYDIKVRDLLKAELVLGHIGEVDEKTQHQAFFELSRADDDFAIPLLVDILVKKPVLDDTFPMLRETLFAKVLDDSEILNNLLRTELDSRKRIILMQVAGESRMPETTDVLMSIVNEEQDYKIIKTALWALGMIGDSSATSSISEYLYSNTAELVVAAIKALGELASPTAIQRLSEKLNEDHDLDLLILNEFSRAQTPEALNKLNSCLSSHYAHQRTAAKQRLIKIGNKVVPNLMNNLLQHDTDLQIHTLNVLGDIGDESAITSIRKLLHNEPKDPNVRFAAYEALGLLPIEKGAFALAAGLEDPVDNVRAAAARAIDVNYNMVLAAGLKNILREKDLEKQKIIQTIIDAECDTLFIDLCQEEIFTDFALPYLSNQAHPDLRAHFITLLNENDLQELAGRLDKASAPKAKVSALKVFAVDDSKMILNIYRSILHSLGCESFLFEFPAEALDKVKNIKPDIILTDLNMPDIDGIELTKKIREIFNKKQLPIIMVTTQNEVQDNEAAYAAGVDKIINKPFNEEQIGKILTEFGS